MNEATTTLTRAGEEETLRLDFKAFLHYDLKSADDKRLFARCLSGFANSAGGLLIWGVDAREIGGIDRAQSTKEIPNVRSFVSRLTQLTGDAIDPRIDGIQHRALARRSGSGFAATLVPESDIGPHMAKLGDDRYHKRSGANFYKMEHFDIADMFGRRRKPKLVLSKRIVSGNTGSEVILGLHNEGRAPASAPYMAFRSSGPLRRSQFGLDGNRHEGIPRQFYTGEDYPERYGADATFVIHPGVTVDVARLTRTMGNTPSAGPIDLQIDYEICAENMPLERGLAMVHLDF